MDDDLAGQLGCPANCLASVCRLALVPYFSRQQQSLALAANTLFGLAGQQRERADLQLMRPLAAPDVSIILITASARSRDIPAASVYPASWTLHRSLRDSRRHAFEARLRCTRD